MHLKFRNVNDAFRRLVEGFWLGQRPDRLQGFVGEIITTKKDSRNGPVLMIEEPVTITYTHPRERVLFNQSRDANPFFHLYESLWMLAGRNDIAPLVYYAENYKNYSDDGKTANGAYGHRWRRAAGKPVVISHGHHHSADHPAVDQLQILIQHLKADPNSRRAVLQMWNVEDDLLKIGCAVCDGRAKMMFMRDPGPCPSCGSAYRKRPPASKDVCCNLSVMFSIRSERTTRREAKQEGKLYRRGADEAKTDNTLAIVDYLDMTVTNRSNDMIWGMLGANYVHFTFLQEYMAAHLGCEVGVYNQFTNNLHVYTNNWEPEKWLADLTPYKYQLGPYSPENKILPHHMIPFVKDPAVFDKELCAIVDCYSHKEGTPEPDYREPFFEDVVRPSFNAFRLHKHRLYPDALAEASLIKADDWRIVCTNWIEKRRRMWEQREMQKTNYTQGAE